MSQPQGNRWPLIAAALVCLGVAAAWWTTRGADPTPGQMPTAAPSVAPASDARVATTTPPEDPPGSPSQSAPDRVELGVFVDGPGAPPDDAPRVLALHGRGDTAADFARAGPQFSERVQFRALQAPLAWQNGWAWFPSGPRAAPTEAIEQAVARVQAHVLQAGERPLAMVGFSQGCMTLLHYLARHPERMRAAICIGGAAVGQLPTPAGPVRTPILFVHGSADRMVPVAAARSAIQAMENRGFSTEFIEHAGGHEIPRDELPRIRGWLEKRLALDQPG